MSKLISVLVSGLLATTTFAQIPVKSSLNLTSPAPTASAPAAPAKSTLKPPITPAPTPATPSSSIAVKSSLKLTSSPPTDPALTTKPTFETSFKSSQATQPQTSQTRITSNTGAVAN
jgi:hypothetical protein